MSSVDIRRVLDQRLLELINDGVEIDMALAVTSDGHIVSTAQKRDVPLQRLGAMGSTLMSLGDTITHELGMGSCRNIIAENEGGIVAFMHITKNLVMVSMTPANGSLGLLLSASRNCVASILLDIKNLKQTERGNGNDQS